MFSKNESARKAQPQTYSKGKAGKMETIIGANTIIEGVLRGYGTVRIDGRITGAILAEEATIIVGDTGFVDAKVHAKHMIISGEVHGNLVISGTLELMATGKLYGYVQSLGLQIADGALFRGNCDMFRAEPLSMPESNDPSVNSTQE